MKDWLTARELAAEELPHIPTTERAVQVLADREGWNADDMRCRRHTGRGGGREYHFSLLPADAQIAYRAKHLRVGSPVMPPAANDEPEARQSRTSLSNRAALERDARLAIVRAFEQFSRGRRLNKGATEHLFVTKYAHGSLQVEDWVRDLIKPFSRRTLARWRDEALLDRDSLAFDRGSARKGTGVIETAEDGKLRIHVLALLADNQHLSADHVRTLCIHEFGPIIRAGAKSIDMPPVRTFQHALKALRTIEKVVLTKLQNPDLYRSTMAPAGRGTLRHIDTPNALWMIDASPVDALCLDGRHHVYACIDIATRRTILSISKTPRASAVALLVRKAMLAWGVPTTIKTDNGSDFVARDTKRLLASLNVEMELSDAYTPQQKGHVERVIRTFQHDCATLLPGFVGHDVADRKAIESRKSFAARLGESDVDAFGVELSGADLQDAADRWIELRYQHRAHEGLNRRTPFDVAAAAAGTVRTVDERALDLLLMQVAGGTGTRRVTRFGIRVDHRHYMTPTILPGTDVFVRMDSADLGLVYAFAADGAEFLGVGICPELSGIHPETAAQALKAQHREIVERGTAAIKAEIRRLRTGPSYIEKVLEVAAANVPNVVPLPRREERHSTPQIEAAIEAMDAAGDRHRLPVTDPKVAAEQRRMIAELEAEEMARVNASHEAKLAARAAEIEAERVAHLPAAVTPLPESAKDRYRRHWQIRQRHEAGEPVDPADLVLLGRYETTSEFRGQRDVHEAFGDEYLAL